MIGSIQPPETIGSPTRARTWDLRINSPSLYQLSYRGTVPSEGGGILEDASRQVKATNSETLGFS